jgi:hypothetical protein
MGERGFEILRRHRAFKRHHLIRRFAEVSQGPNLYGFVGNNAIGRSDPLGLSYDSEECAGLLNEIDFMYSLLGRTGIDRNSVQQQINDLEDEYDDNCGDDDGPGNQPQPVPVPAPSECKKKVVQAATWATIGTVVYWIISEGSRLFPPRNLVPIP